MQQAANSIIYILKYYSLGYKMDNYGVSIVLGLDCSSMYLWGSDWAKYLNLDYLRENSLLCLLDRLVSSFTWVRYE